MTKLITRVFGGVLLVVTGVALAALSSVPYVAEAPGPAIVRLSWRYRIAPTQECRTRTAEELAALPVHMRTPEVCERGIPSYRMSMQIDGDSIFEDVIRPAGAAGDRPLYVHRDLQVNPGVHRIEVRFVPLADGGAEEGGLSFDRSVTISPGEVALVTYDSKADRLELVGPSGGG
jgi:hypothetical protein